MEKPEPSGDKASALWTKILWILRISASLCFIGHGAFGIITKAEWLPFFGLFRIPPEIAFQLMPLIGLMDIGLGLLILFFPFRITLAYMTFWSVWTALLRPLIGLSWWEFFERAGNYGVPLTLLILSGFPRKISDWFQRLHHQDFLWTRHLTASWILRLTVGLVSIGHGGFGAFIHKSMLVDHFASIGLPPGSMDPVLFLTLFGWFEILLGIAIIIRPYGWLLLFSMFLKIGIELLYPISGYPYWEFIERWGSYGAPLALFYIQRLEVLRTAHSHSK